MGGPDVATSIPETRRELVREANSDIHGNVSSLDNSIAGAKVLLLPWHLVATSCGKDTEGIAISEWIRCEFTFAIFD
jgi:hypothetical protein